MADENEEVEVEMTEAEEGVMIEVPDETEVQEPEDEPEPEAVEETVVETPPVVKRPKRKPKVVETPTEETETPAEEPEEVEPEEEPEADFAAVLARLVAIEALLTAEPDETDPVVDENAVARANKAELKLLAFKVGTRHGLSEVLIERLRGEDEDSLTKDALALAGEAGSGRGSLGKGGLDPDEDAFDPKKFIKNLRKQNNGGL